MGANRPRPGELLVALEVGARGGAVISRGELADRCQDPVAVPASALRTDAGSVEPVLPASKQRPDRGTARPARVFPCPLLGHVGGWVPVAACRRVPLLPNPSSDRA